MKKVQIIAEAGVNHNGNLDLAKKLVDAAANAGVDYVKFQTFNAKSLVSKSAKRADYQVKNTGSKNGGQLDMLMKLELSKESHFILKDYCREKGVKFLSTGFDLESLQFLYDFGLDVFKVPSGEITNLPYLRKIGGFLKPTIVSTGMANMNEIAGALNVLMEAGQSKESITVLHCNTEYPTPMKDVNLRAMQTINESFGVPIGYSDHTLGIEVPIAAVAMGAKIIEKHFTLNRQMKGPDHKASLEPDELKSMVQSIRNIEVALGNGEKVPSQSELKNKIVARKSIVALKDIKEGEFLTEENLTVKRPGNGISPMKWDEVLGTKASKNYKEDDLI